MGAEKLKAQVQGDTANWRSIKSEENKASMEPACEKKNRIHFTCMVYTRCAYTLPTYVRTHAEYMCLQVLDVCTHLHTNAHPYT